MKKGMTTLGAVAAIALAGVYSASAGVTFSLGNFQYTNVNIVADVDALSVTGHIGNTGLHAIFQDMLGPDGTTPVSIHGQHGVAFIESTYDSQNTSHTGFASLTIVPDPGYAFTAGDFALDQLAGLTSPTGLVTFTAQTVVGGPYTASLAIDANGQNHYNFTTSAYDLVTSLTITVPTTDLLQDLKQLSLEVQPVPEASTVGAMVAMAGVAGFVGWRRGSRRGA